MIALYTDFGLSGHYVGQMKAILLQQAPAVPIIDLMHDAPVFDPQAAAYLLAALVGEFPPDTVFLCVVDPGVGGQRKPVILKAGQQWFIGPDNGLFNIVIQHALPKNDIECWDITWQPKRLSASFHGRDLFAPVAAKLANTLVDKLAGKLADKATMPGVPRTLDMDIVNLWPGDLSKIIYVDHYGNAITGIRASSLPDTNTIFINNEKITRANTFSDVSEGQGFCYQNANGLMEIAVNQGRADQQYQLRIGSAVQVGAS